MVEQSNWPRVSIAELCASIVDCVNKTAPVVDGPTRYKMIRTTNVRDGWIDLSSVRYVTAATYEKWTRRQKPRRGDVILTREAPLGEVGMLRSDDDVFLGQRLVAYRADPSKLDNRFLLYAMLADDLQGQIRSMGSGATVEHMRVPDCEKLILRLPPLQIQRQIASILSAYDNLIENNTRRIAILEEMARRIYEEWFVRFRFPGHEGVRMVESEWGLVPHGWEVTSLGAVAENHDRFRRPLSKMEREAFKGPYPYYGAAKVFDYVREYLFDGQFLLLAEDGSVETPDGYPVLQLTYGKFWANNHTHILRGTARASTEYLYLRLERQPIRGYITGAAQPKLTQAAINRIPLVLPPSDLLRKFDTKIQSLFQLRATLMRSNTNLRTTRDLLLPKLISGELDVSALPEPQALAA